MQYTLKIFHEQSYVAHINSLTYHINKPNEKNCMILEHSTKFNILPDENSRRQKWMHIFLTG